MILLVSVSGTNHADTSVWLETTYTSKCQNPRDWRYRHIAGRTRRDNLMENLISIKSTYS